VISYLRIIVNPRDELAWKRVLKMIPGVGNATANRVYEAMMVRTAYVSGWLNAADENVETSEGDVTAILKSVVLQPPVCAGGTDSFARLRSSQSFKKFILLLEILVQQENRNNPAKQIELVLTHGYEQYLQENYENADLRIEDLKGLAAYATRYKSTEDFLSELALLSTERFKEPQPLVGEELLEGAEEDELLTLTSVHQAKGLEWKAVFIIWAAEGKFPSPRSLREIDSEEEERRLWYVAVTRSKDELYLTYPLLLTDHNRQTVLQKPSRFITECPAEIFEIWNLEEAAAIENSQALSAGATEYLN
jgi:DNA helicase-2/ATP-dependent DNA helicase PcrA